jgi:energy-converting hydrogenase Eha subunit F
MADPTSGEDAMKAMAKALLIVFGIAIPSALWAQDTKPGPTPTVPAPAAAPAAPAASGGPAAKREAPVGHKQPRAVEAPAAAADSPIRENASVQKLEQADKRIRALTMRGICSNC